MKFSEMPYERLNLVDIQKDYGALLDELERQRDPKDFEKTFYKINDYRTHLQTMKTLCMIRHSIDTSDDFYSKEQDYWDETSPLVGTLEDRFSKICLAYPKRDELDIPKTFFMLAEYGTKCFSEDIVPLLQKENKLTSEYGKLKASAKIAFDGKVFNLASIRPYTLSNDRNTRQRACEAINAFYTENEKEFDRIYDELVHTRDEMAKRLGYKDYVEFGYYRMCRFDYDRKMVANYRRQVLNDIVPVTREIYQRQKERLGLDELRAWDLDYAFKTGSPKPVGGKDELVAIARDMYHDLSEETGAYFDMMIEEELFDLETKPNKEMGGYMAPIPEYKRPFIFSNFNGTSGDVDVLVHEAGHGLQTYLTYKNHPNIIMELCGPTMEACEVHSMSMEFFAHPYMDKFFGKDKTKYLYSHIADALTFIPYGTLVDHFQHEVYENPDMSAQERKATWHRLETMYCPDRNFEGLDLLQRGGWYYRQGHIFESPFYYIDYTLAQVCALQFFTRTLKGDKKAFADYLALCRLGGYDTFLNLLKVAGLKSPFEDESLKEVAYNMRLELEKFDVSDL